MTRVIQILFFILPVFGFSQTDTIVHLYAFGGNNNDSAEEIEATTDGGYVVIGATSSNSWGNTDGYLLKVDSMCNYEWSIALGGANNDWGYSIKQTFDKGFIIASTSNSYGNGGYDAVLMKRDSLGNYEWRKVYGGQDWDFAYSVVQTYDSGYVFCGETYNNSNGYSDVFIVKTNRLGDTLWTRTYGGALIDKGNSVIETSDSNIVVAGITNTLTDSTDIYVIKLTPNGTLIWDSIYGNSLYENANAIIETVNGDYVLAGSTTSFSPTGDKDYYLLRTDKNGATLWSNFFGAPAIPEDDEAFDLFENVNGDLIAVGETSSFGAGLKDAQLFYVTSSGGWGGLGPTFGNTDNESFRSITVGKDGDYCIAGHTDSYGNGLNDVFIVRLDTVYLGQDTAVINYIDTIPLNVKEIDEKVEFDVYPNPAKKYVIVKRNNNNKNNSCEFVLRDIQGRIILIKNITEQSDKIVFKNLDKGIYIFSINDSQNVIENGMLIIN